MLSIRRTCGLLILSWTFKTFFTASGAAQFLDTLPEERQWESKVSCADLGLSCTVFYRIERDVAVK
jgi:hypothetical protein